MAYWAVRKLSKVEEIRVQLVLPRVGHRAIVCTQNFEIDGTDEEGDEVVGDQRRRRAVTIGGWVTQAGLHASQGPRVTYLVDVVDTQKLSHRIVVVVVVTVVRFSFFSFMFLFLSPDMKISLLYNHF